MTEPPEGIGSRLDNSLSTFLPLRYRAFFVVVLVTLAPVAFVLASSSYEGTLRERLQEETAAAADAVGSELASGHAQLQVVRDVGDDWRARVRLLSASRQVLAAHDGTARGHPWDRVVEAFAGPGGRRLAELDTELGGLATRPEIDAAAARGEDHGCQILDEQRVLRCFAVRALDDGSYVYVDQARPRGTRALYEQRYQVLKVALFVLPGALLLAAWLSWRMIRPIERLRRQIQRRAGQAAPKADLPVERSDEFGELATAFNELLRRLQARSEENERFVADLAHEFKNPVAAIRAAAERLQDGELTAERAARISSVLERSSRQLDALLGQFLELASADAGMRGEERSDVSLAGLLEALVEQLRADERFASVRFELGGEADATLSIVERRVTSALRNLLENAASFAGPGGTVKVRVAAANGQLVVEVEDSGPGIAPEDLPRVFDRFFTRREGGTGLGLSLARAVVEAHGGFVEARSEPGKGAVFALHFPTAAA